MIRKIGVVGGLWLGCLVAGCAGKIQSLGDLPGGAAGAASGSPSGAASGGSPGSGGPSGVAGGGLQGSDSGAQFGSGGNAAPTPTSCETDCVHQVLTGTVASCKLCHAARRPPDGLQSAQLDLESVPVIWRLKDVPATHGDIVPPMGVSPDCVYGDKLIDSVNPERSWLLRKLDGQQGNCGSSMPQPPTTLKLEEQQCMHRFVTCVAAL